MKSVIFIFPELASFENSVLNRASSPILKGLTSSAKIFRLSPHRSYAEFLGIPTETEIPDGPLMVAALGHRPPESSVHFSVSLMSFEDGVASKASFPIPHRELAELLSLASKLNTKTLTFLEGWQENHALVWEQGSLDLQTYTPTERFNLEESLPQGDGETLLRQFIDDSINLLTDTEFNKRRIGEGLQPLNLLWPFGHGFRPVFPNLLLEYGPVFVSTLSPLLAGASRIANWKHSEWRVLTVKEPNFAAPLRFLEQFPRLIVHMDAWKQLATENEEEKADWLLDKLEKTALEPLLLDLDKPKISLISPGKNGIGLIYDPSRPEEPKYPFDKRIWEETKSPELPVFEAVKMGLSLVQ